MGPENQDFLGPEMAKSLASAIWAPKKWDFQGPPLPVGWILDLPPSKSLNPSAWRKIAWYLLFDIFQNFRFKKILSYVTKNLHVVLMNWPNKYVLLIKKQIMKNEIFLSGIPKSIFCGLSTSHANGCKQLQSPDE